MAEKPTAAFSALRFVVGLIIFVFGVVLWLWQPQQDSNTVDPAIENAGSPSPPRSYLVTYEVTGSASSVSLTMADADGDTCQESKMEVPCYWTFRAKPGSFVYISAQNQGDTGSVTVTIYRGQEIIKTSTSRGAYVIAQASATL